MRKPIRAVAIVIKDSSVLLIHRKNEKEYYAFPGGGVEENETIEQAVLRELKEETKDCFTFTTLLTTKMVVINIFIFVNICPVFQTW